MATISKATKAEMVTALLNHAFADRIKAADAQCRKIGDELWEEIYKAEKRHMLALPNKFLETAWYLKININGQCRQVDFSEHKRVARTHNSFGNYPVFEDSHPVIVRWVAAKDAESAIKQEKSKAKKNAEAVLERCTTFKKLWETWPEAHEILKHFDKPAGGVYLPAIPMPELNKALGLKV